MKITYQIMQANQTVAVIDTEGQCTIYKSEFMPYNLYLEEQPQDMDTRFNNLANFYFWCASRLLTLDRTYAKEILNSIGMTQATTDKERAQIALSYHCLCLTDIYWVKNSTENIEFQEINLFENSLGNAFVDVALRGKQMSITNSYLIADDISTNGLFPKAWYRAGDEIVLLKDGSVEAVENELLASKICQCFACSQTIYQEAFYDGVKVSKSSLMTSLKYSIVSREAFEIYAVNYGVDVQDFILKLDGYSYYMMNILDYLIGNTDRHWGNWGFLVDNETNRPVRLHDLMDFNKAFSSYDTMEGANCLTVPHSYGISQREAAQEAVRKIGLNQVADVSMEWFSGKEQLGEMFHRRLCMLKSLV